MVLAIHTKEIFSVNVFEVLRMLKLAWHRVKLGRLIIASVMQDSQYLVTLINFRLKFLKLEQKVKLKKMNSAVYCLKELHLEIICLWMMG